MTPAPVAQKTYLALVHYPVYDKHRRVVATSVTNLDIHDIARSSKTYGVEAYYIVHPVTAQEELVKRILGHWQDGPGQEYNDFRRNALSLVRVAKSLDNVIDEITKRHDIRPLVVGTSAVVHEAAQTENALLLDPERALRPLLLVFGTGWGLAEEALSKLDRMLRPIQGSSGYNHLSVRTAAGIILDRLFCEPGRVAGESRP